MVSSSKQCRHFQRSLLSKAVFCGLAITPLWVNAEEVQADSEAKKIEVIQVTTQKRVENSQEVPIALSVFSHDTLRKLGAQSIDDLGKATPGLETNNRSVTQPKYDIRGVRNNDFGIGSESNVVIYQDGVSIGRSGNATMNFNDIERIEVLKGPQGTLFGKNAAAGAIHVISKKPHEDFEANYRLTYGEYNKRKAEGLINFALSDDVYFRASAVVNRRDGYLDALLFDDPAQGQVSDDYKKVELLDEYDNSLRASLLWQASSNTEVVWRSEFNEVNQDSRPAYTVNPDLYREIDGSTDPYGTYETDSLLKEGRNLFGSSVEVNSDFDWGTFTSITAYKRFTTFNDTQEDGSANARVYFNLDNTEEQDFFSQEFRFTGVTENGLKWTLGANYSREELEQTTDVRMMSDTIDSLAINTVLRKNGIPPNGIPEMGIPGLLDTPPGTGITGLLLSKALPQLMQLSQLTGIPPQQLAMQIAQHNLGKTWTESTYNTADNTSMGLFADVTYPLTERLDLTAGVRWSKDDKDFTILSYFQNGLDIPIPGVPSLPVGFAFGTEYYDRDAEGNAILDESGNYMPVKQSESWSKVTPRFVLDYQLSDKVMLFASYAEGFKAGGFNSLAVADPFDEEQIENIEVGMKSTLFDDSLRFNISLFDYDYTDLQLIKLTGQEGSIPTYNVRNVDAKGQGLELETVWVVTDDLSLDFNYAYLDTEYTKYSLFEGESEEDDLTGQPLSSVPKNKFYLAADYYIELEDAEINLNLNYTWVDDRTGLDTPPASTMPIDPALIQGLDQYNKMKSYGVTNFRATYNAEEWGLAFYVNNLTDEEYLQQPVRGQGAQVGAPTVKGIGKPRMWGIEFYQTF